MHTLLMRIYELGAITLDTITGSLASIRPSEEFGVTPMQQHVVRQVEPLFKQLDEHAGPHPRSKELHHRWNITLNDGRLKIAGSEDFNFGVTAV